MPDTVEILKRTLFGVNPISPANWIIYVICMIAVRITVGHRSVLIGWLVGCFVSATLGYNIFIKLFNTATLKKVP